MALNRTGLVIVAAPLPPDFCGTLQEFYQEMVERFQIMSPSGIAFFSQGSVLPSSNMGLFLLNGTQLYVFNEDTGQYEPLDISASESDDFFVGPDDPGAPAPGQPVFWLKTNGSRLVGVYAWTGSEWRASANIDSSGTTAQRPVNPTDLEHYFDTDINVELRFERGAWRSAAGAPGDVKQVTHTTLSEARRFNPGWELLGFSDEAQRGRLLGQAAKDPGATPANSFATSSGITARAAGDLAGAETHLLLSAEIEPHCHSVGIYAPADPNGMRFHREDNADVLATPSPVPPNGVSLSGDGRTPVNGVSGPGAAGEGIITSGQFLKTVAPNYCGTSSPHNNLPQTLFLWTLYKT